MDKASSYSTTKFTPWHDNICYFGFGCLGGSAVTACAARYFYYHLTGTPQFVINTHKYTKILSGVLFGVGLCSVIRSCSVDSFIETAKSTFAIWDIQKNKLSFSGVKTKYPTLLNLSSFQKGYIPLLIEDLHQGYEPFITKHSKDVESYLKDTNNSAPFQEAKQAYIDVLVKKLNSSLNIPGYQTVDQFIVLSQHSMYGKKLMDKNFENILTNTLKDISWHACFIEQQKSLIDLFKNEVISDVNKLVLKDKFLDGLKTIQTNIIDTKKSFSEVIKNLVISDKELYQAATASERSKWMTGQLSYLDLRAKNDEYLVNHLTPEEITKLGGEMSGWTYSKLNDQKYANEKKACGIDILQIISNFPGDYSAFCDFHGRDALQYASKTQIMDWSKEERPLWINHKLAYLDLRKKYGSNIAKYLEDFKDVIKIEMIETWSYRDLTSPTYQIDRDTFGIEHGDIIFAMQNFQGTYFGDKGFRALHGREAISRLDDHGRLRYTEEVKNAFATSSFEALKEDCIALGINRGEILRGKWNGKGYFQICNEENGSKLFWDAVKAKEVFVNEYRVQTLREMEGHMHSLANAIPIPGIIDASTSKFWMDVVNRNEIYIQRLILDHPMLFSMGIIIRNDWIHSEFTIADFFYFHTNQGVTQLANLQSISLLEQVEKLYSPYIWSLGLLHADDLIMQSWIANEIREIIAKNASRERYHVCLQNKLVASHLSELLRDYDQFVQKAIELKNSKILGLEKSYSNEKREAENKNKKALSAEKEKLKKLKEDWECKKAKFEQAEENYSNIRISLTKIKDAISDQETLISSKKTALRSLKKEMDESSLTRKKIEDENTQYNARKSTKEKQHDLSSIPKLKTDLSRTQLDILRISKIKEETDKLEAGLLAIQERIASRKSLTTKLAGLESEQKQLSTKNVTGVEDANALKGQQNSLAAQIKEISEKLAKLNVFKDQPIEQITAAVESMKKHKDYLDDCSTQNTLLKEIQDKLLKLEPIQNQVNILTSKIQTNNQKLEKIYELSSRFTKLNEEIGSLEVRLETLKNDQAEKSVQVETENISRRYLMNSYAESQEKYHQAKTSFKEFKENQEREYQAGCKRLEQQLSAEKEEVIKHFNSNILSLQNQYLQQYGHCR